MCLWYHDCRSLSFTFRPWDEYSTVLGALIHRDIIEGQAASIPRLTQGRDFLKDRCVG